jgi:hypothetical protein
VHVLSVPHSKAKSHASPSAVIPLHAEVMQAATHGSAVLIVAQVSAGASIADRHELSAAASNRTRLLWRENSIRASERSHSRSTSLIHSSSVRGSVTRSLCSISPSEQHEYML